MVRKFLPNRVFLRCLIMLSIATCSFADGISSLNTFLSVKNDVISANFKQTVFGHKKNQVSIGTMQIYRPNKFKWQYDNQGNNVGQQIISDGKKVYIVDKELEQVTYKDLGKTIDKSPAMILAGSNDIKKFYNIANLPDSNGIEWVGLTPKVAKDNNGFQAIAMGFNKKTHQLSSMKFTDNFGGKSQIDFYNLKIERTVKKDEFEFVAPHGYDVINGN